MKNLIRKKIVNENLIRDGFISRVLQIRKKNESYTYSFREYKKEILLPNSFYEAV